VIENLLGMNLDLAQERRRDRVAVALIGEDGHASFDAERFQDRLRDAKRQTVERPDDDDPVVAFADGFNPPSQRRNDFTKDRR